MRRLALLALSFLTMLQAQYPPDTHWRKIDTSHFEVVFPREITQYAERVANTLEALYPPLTQTLGARPKRTTVLLANQDMTRYVGGYVSLFPREAVFNTMPAQGFWGANDWSAMLAAHEGSYLVQIEKMKHGFGKLTSTLFGETGTAAVIGWTLPDWSMQGQARAAETGLTRGGVGQFGSSEAATRAMLLSGEAPSYMKAMHGSFRDFVPDSAELGEFLVNHINRISGADAWDKIMALTAKNSWNPWALSMSMKQVTGRDAATNYAETVSELGELWKSKAEQTDFSKPAILNLASKSVFTSYYQPVFEADGAVLAQKAGFDTYPVEMVRIHPDGREERLFRVAPTVNGSNRTSVVNGKMVVDEYVPDVRWRRGYSEIVIRDMQTGRTRRLTHGTRFMNPALSPDGGRVAVVEFLPDRSCSLVILDAGSGSELQRLASPGNDMIYTPAWQENGRRMAMVTQGAGGRALMIVELESGKFEEAVPHSFDDLANPLFHGEYVLYASSVDGIRNIYAVQVATGRRYRVTSSKFGANFPNISLDGTKLLYSDYSSKGDNVAELPLDPASWTPMGAVGFSGIAYHGSYRDYTGMAGAAYPAVNYSPAAHLFAFHSWGLTSGPPDLGFGLISDDKMGLLDFHASAIYNTNERTPGFETSASYNRFFPVLDFSFSERERSLSFVDGKENWTERTAFAGVRVPLNLSRGYYNNRLTVSSGVESVHLHGSGLVPLTYGVSLRRVRQSAARDLAPVWGQDLRFSYREAPWRGLYTANFLSADGRLALPGLARHHSLQLEAGYERQNGNYYFSSELLFPRGYSAIVGPNLTKFSGTYAVPLLYPDLALGQLGYLKRVSGDVFYDYGKVADTQYRSAGVELGFDVGVLHFSDSLRVGLRYAYLLDYKSSRVQPFIAYRW